MTFQEKVKFLRTIPKFKVTPIPEIKAIAFAAKEVSEQRFVKLGEHGSTALFLNEEDINKILRVYPDLKSRLA